MCVDHLHTHLKAIRKVAACIETFHRTHQRVYNFCCGHWVVDFVDSVVPCQLRVKPTERRKSRRIRCSFGIVLLTCLCVCV